MRAELIDFLNECHESAWNLFDYVLTTATTLGLVKGTTVNWRTPGEPAQVSRLIEHPFNYQTLAHIAGRHLTGVGGKVLVSGLFIHQKPKVRFKTNHRVELGDLLFARQHFVTADAAPQNRAFLLQAKAGRLPRTGRLSGNELQQFLLYSNWGREFMFPHGEIGDPPDGSRYWDLSKGPSTPQTDTGFYGLVSSDRLEALAPEFPEECAWAAAAAPATGALPAKHGAAAPPAAVDASAMSLAELLEGFLRGTRGRTWASAPEPQDHWSHLVQGLLDAAIAHKWSYPVQRIGAYALPRHRNLLHFVDRLAAIGSTFPSLYDGVQVASGTDFEVARERWRDSVNGLRPPPDEPEQEEPRAPLRALSVVYVATFGDEPLREGDPEQEPPSDRF